MTTRDIALIVGIMLVCFSFLAGVDDAMNKKDEASHADKLRVYCNTPGHSPNLCYKGN